MGEHTQTANKGLVPSGRLVVLFVLFCTLLRVFFVTSIPLLGAEAYYWEWSQNLDWGYFDHPPMLAFFIFLSTGLCGDSVLSVKLVPVVLGLLTAGVVYLLARDMFGKAVAAVVCCVFQVVPFFAALCVLAVPDAPLAFFWMLTLLCVYRAACMEKPSYWYAAGVVLGLALLSKYHAFLLFPCVALFLVASRSLRFWFRRKEPYCAVAIAFFVFAPNLVWNVTRGMRTFEFLLLERHDTIALHPGGLVAFAGGILVMLSPLLAVLAAWLVPQLFRRGLSEADNRYLLLVCTSVPIVAFFAVLSPLISIGFHWPGVAYPSLVLATVALLCTPSRPGDPVLGGRFARASIVVSLVFVLVAHGIPLLFGVLPPKIQFARKSIRLDTIRLYTEMHGWPELAQRLLEARAIMPDPDRTFVITRSYRMASQIRFYCSSDIMTRTTGRRDPHQYRYWNNQRDVFGWDALFVDKKYSERKRDILQALFNDVGTLEKIDIRQGTDVIRTFYAVPCYGFKGQAGSSPL
jgi:dolichol-phosphate mannosyltransferase